MAKVLGPGADRLHGGVRVLEGTPVVAGSPDKERPVLILTRGSALGYLARVTVAPITSTIRGVPSEVALGVEDGMKQPCAVKLHNVVTVARDRLGRRVAQLPADRMRRATRTW